MTTHLRRRSFGLATGYFHRVQLNWVPGISRARGFDDADSRRPSWPSLKFQAAVADET